MNILVRLRFSVHLCIINNLKYKRIRFHEQWTASVLASSSFCRLLATRRHTPRHSEDGFETATTSCPSHRRPMFSRTFNHGIVQKARRSARNRSTLCDMSGLASQTCQTYSRPQKFRRRLNSRGFSILMSQPGRTNPGSYSQFGLEPHSYPSSTTVPFAGWCGRGNGSLQCCHPLFGIWKEGARN